MFEVIHTKCKYIGISFESFEFDYKFFKLCFSLLFDWIYIKTIFEVFYRDRGGFPCGFNVFSQK